jgi:hypothetical protein
MLRSSTSDPPEEKCDGQTKEDEADASSKPIRKRVSEVVPLTPENPVLLRNASALRKK